MRVLLAILEAGGGHRSAARSVAAAMQERRPDADVVIEDVGQGGPLPFANDAPAAYRLFLDSPARPAFEVAWRVLDRRATSRTLVAAAYPFIEHHAEAVVRRLRPDLIVGVHAGVSQVFRRLRRSRRHRYAVATVVTDIVSVHALWADAGADLTLVPTEEARRRVLDDGCQPGTTCVTGFPIHPDFVRAARSATGPTTEPPACPSVLLMGGGAGAGRLDEMLAGLDSSPRPLRIEVVTGRNPELYDRLHRETFHHNVRVHGFVTEMAALMSACDVVVTKAGPGSLMEAWALRKPTLVGATVGPQEVGNLEWGERRGLARPAGGPRGVARALDDLLDGWPQTVAAMQPIDVEGSYRIADALLSLADATPRGSQAAASIR